MSFRPLDMLRAIKTRCRCSRNARYLMFELLGYVDDTGETIVSLVNIAPVMGVKRNTLAAAEKELVKAGWLEVERRGFSTASGVRLPTKRRLVDPDPPRSKETPGQAQTGTSPGSKEDQVQAQSGLLEPTEPGSNGDPNQAQTGREPGSNGAPYLPKRSAEEICLQKDPLTPKGGTGLGGTANESCWQTSLAIGMSGPPPTIRSSREPRRPKPAVTAEQAYRAASDAGIREAAPGKPFALPPGKIGSILGPAMAAHAPGLRGDPLLAWLRQKASLYRKATADSAQYQGGWGIPSFVKWLNTRADESSDPTLTGGHERDGPHYIDSRDATGPSPDEEARVRERSDRQQERAQQRLRPKEVKPDAATKV